MTVCSSLIAGCLSMMSLICFVDFYHLFTVVLAGFFVELDDFVITDGFVSFAFMVGSLLNFLIFIVCAFADFCVVVVFFLVILLVHSGDVLG
jgi:hypothetical protein